MTLFISQQNKHYPEMNLFLFLYLKYLTFRTKYFILAYQIIQKRIIFRVTSTDLVNTTETGTAFIFRLRLFFSKKIKKLCNKRKISDTNIIEARRTISKRSHHERSYHEGKEEPILCRRY